MMFRLVRPVRRKGTLNQQFSQRIPADVRERAKGLTLRIPLGENVVSVTISPTAQHVRLSLRTFIPHEVKARQAQVIGYLETVWSSLRQETPITLTRRQMEALAKAVYDEWAEERPGESIGIDYDRETGTWGRLEAGLAADTPEAWQAVRESALGWLEDNPLPALRRRIDHALMTRGIGTVDEASYALIARSFLAALKDGISSRERHAGGDFRPDPNASRFPEWPDEDASTKTLAAGKVSLTGLVDEWWSEAQAAGRTVSTYESYRATFAKLADFLKHDDADKVTPTNVVAFKDHRLSQGISPKTVGDSDVAGLRSVFQWAVENHKLDSNPAEKVKVKRPKTTRTRGSSFTSAEASALLAQSLHYEKAPREAAKLAAAKRWVPWLCAYTGARVGEMVQLRKEDVRQESGLWVLTITPEAGTVKDKEVRDVVLHDHLIEQGFLKFVEDALG